MFNDSITGTNQTPNIKLGIMSENIPEANDKALYFLKTLS